MHTFEIALRLVASHRVLVRMECPLVDLPRSRRGSFIGLFPENQGFPARALRVRALYPGKCAALL
jgi:hypothetical protein